MKPYVSVIVPIKEERIDSSDFKRLIAALEVQQFRNFEVIIVVDGLADLPAWIDTAFVRSRRFLVLPSPRAKGVGWLRRRGLQEARGTYSIFTDDDTVPSPVWLDQYKKVWDAFPNALIAGPDDRVNGEGFGARAMEHIFRYLWRDLHKDSAASFRRPTAKMCTSANCGFPTAEGLRVGYGQVTGSSADRAFLELWKISGKTAIYCPEIVVKHGKDLTLTQAMKQWKWYGKGGYRVQQWLIATSHRRISVITPLYWLRLAARMPDMKLKTAAALMHLAYVYGYVTAWIEDSKA